MRVSSCVRFCSTISTAQGDEQKSYERALKKNSAMLELLTKNTRSLKFFADSAPLVKYPRPKVTFVRLATDEEDSPDEAAASATSGSITSSVRSSRGAVGARVTVLAS
jgi:hypothetical protein